MKKLMKKTRHERESLTVGEHHWPLVAYRPETVIVGGGTNSLRRGDAVCFQSCSYSSLAAIVRVVGTY